MRQWGYEPIIRINYKKKNDKDDKKIKLVANKLPSSLILVNSLLNPLINPHSLNQPIPKPIHITDIIYPDFLPNPSAILIPFH